ncbi:hypothetical protein HDR60_05290 [bacterium]|nr:hypothetical protein [bacterium]
MINKYHKDIIKKLSHYIIMICCNSLISAIFGTFSALIYSFICEDYGHPNVSDIEFILFTVISFLIFFSLFTIMNNIVFTNVKNIWIRAFAFALFYILPVYNYIINR